ncbi:hypothetical protein SAMN05444172_2620 [Burkholderia sp. GAS332]|nr:hypothetical protein SAMN05444172_2620 [Burkholderia sp. GAS332]
MPHYLSEYKGHQIDVQVYDPAGGASWSGEFVITSTEPNADVDRRYVPQWEKMPQTADAAHHALKKLAHDVIDGISGGDFVNNG